MKPVCVALLGTLLLLHLLSSQVVQAQEPTEAPSTASSTTVARITNVTVKGTNSCGRMDALTPLLLLALSASLLHGWLH